MPVGIDPGWQGNPGLRRAENAQKLLAGRLNLMTTVQRDVALKDITGSRMFRAIQKNELGYDKDTSPKELRSVTAPVASIPEYVAGIIGLRDHEPRILQFSVADAAKQAGKKERVHFPHQLYENVQRLLTSGEMFKEIGPGKEGVYAFRGDVEGSPFVAVIRITNDRSIVYLKSFRQMSAEGRGKWKKIRG